MNPLLSNHPGRSFVSAVVLWVGACLADAATFDAWSQRAALNVPEPGLQRLVLQAEHLDVARPGLEDLRLTGPDGNEVPYLMERPAPEPGRVRSPKAFQTQLRNTVTLVLIETGTDRKIDAVELEIPAREFIKGVTVESSSDGRNFTPLAKGVPLFRQGGTTGLRVQLPVDMRPWLRLVLDDSRSAPVPVTGALIHEVPADDTSFQTVTARIQSREDVEGQSRLLIDLGAANLAVSRIRLEVGDSLFQRRVNVRIAELVGDELREKEIAADTVYSMDVGFGAASRHTDLVVNRLVPVRELILMIDNVDSSPLKLGGVRVDIRPVDILFQAKAAGAHHLFLGNAHCPAPRYDLAAFASQLKKATTGSVTCDPPRRNPDFRPSETLPGVAESGASIDTNEWRFRKEISLQGQGVQQLELDADVLARSRENFADLRLVRGGVQIPFLIERASVSRPLMPSVRRIADVKRPSVSRWELTLSHTNLPLAKLTCRSRSLLFERHVRLIESIPDGRGGTFERQIGSAQWQRRVEGGNARLVLPIEVRPRTSLLMLETDNGDNPPIELDEFQFALPSIQLVFKSSEAPALFYGNPSVPAPRYDVALVARQLLAAGKSRASLGVEQMLKPAPRPDGEMLTGLRAWIFWGVLAAVVAGLFLVIAKMLPKQSG